MLANGLSHIKKFSCLTTLFGGNKLKCLTLNKSYMMFFNMFLTSSFSFFWLFDVKKCVELFKSSETFFLIIRIIVDSN